MAIEIDLTIDRIAVWEFAKIVIKYKSKYSFFAFFLTKELSLALKLEKKHH